VLNPRRRDKKGRSQGNGNPRNKTQQEGNPKKNIQGKLRQTLQETLKRRSPWKACVAPNPRRRGERKTKKKPRGKQRKP
jgi:hypothetical protein